MRSCDGYVIIKILLDEPVYRLYTCNYGGYLDGDSWRINSGITKVELDDIWEGEGNLYFVHGNSGSVYQIHENQFQKLTGYCSGKLKEILATAGEYQVEIISIEDYLKETSNETNN